MVAVASGAKHKCSGNALLNCHVPFCTALSSLTARSRNAERQCAAVLCWCPFFIPPLQLYTPQASQGSLTQVLTWAAEL